MKTALLIPLAFLAGVHGFAIFAPYLACFLAAVHLLRRRPTPLPVPVHITQRTRP